MSQVTITNTKDVRTMSAEEIALWITDHRNYPRDPRYAAAVREDLEALEAELARRAAILSGPAPFVNHDLKSWVGLFEPIRLGLKPYDLRVLDRSYGVGDICRLREWDPLKRAYTGREVLVEITWITSSAGHETHQPCAFSPIALHPASGILGYRLLSP